MDFLAAAFVGLDILLIGITIIPDLNLIFKIRIDCMDLSIIIPTYNESANIRLLIERVSKQFLGSSIKGEIIIVDDSSPDGTGRIAEVLRSEHENLRVIHRKG